MLAYRLRQVLVRHRNVTVLNTLDAPCSVHIFRRLKHRFRLRRHATPAVFGLAVAACVACLALSGPSPQAAAAAGTAVVAAPATSAMLKPFRGSGTWVDVYDWSKQFGGAAFTPATVDKVAAAGYQTIYIQTTKAGIPDLVLEPARLKSIINRAHQLGLSVVGWYLPTHDDEMRDYRKTIAMLRLGVDGIGLDLESTKVKDVPKRSAAAVRLMRRVDAKLRSANIDMAVAAITYTPYTLESSKRLWPNFPWAALAPYTSVWMPMSYWSQQNKRNNGYSDAATFSSATITRLRQLLGNGARIHLIGGSGMSPTQAAKMVAALQTAAGNVIGGSLYDWRTSASSTHPKMLPLRDLRDASEAAASDTTAAGDIVAYRTASGSLTLLRVAADGTTTYARSLSGPGAGTPGIAIDNRSPQNRWFVAATTDSGAVFTWDRSARATARLANVPGAPQRCTPTAVHWARAGYVLLCTTSAGVKSAQFNPSNQRWTTWQDVPLPTGVRSLVATPLGSDIALAWIGVDEFVHVALWDPAAPADLVVRDVVDAGSSKVGSSSDVRLNAAFSEGSDTASKAFLTGRSNAGVWQAEVTRAGFFAQDMKAMESVADTRTGPVTQIFLNDGSRVAVVTTAGVVSFLP